MLPKSIHMKVFQPNHSASSLMANGLFLRDPQADLYLDLNQHIFPVHRKYLLKSKTITDVPAREKFIIIDSQYELDISMFKNILSLFYGLSLELKTNLELERALEIIDYLQIQELKDFIQRQLFSLIAEFDTFYILNIAYVYSFKQIYDQCFEFLRNQSFEQMLYNKFDLVYCNFQLFQIILRVHQVLQKKGDIVGLDIRLIEEIIQLYCRTQYYNYDTKTKLLQKYGRQNYCPAHKNQTQAIFESKYQGEDSELKLAKLASQVVQSDGEENKSNSNWKKEQLSNSSRSRQDSDRQTLDKLSRCIIQSLEEDIEDDEESLKEQYKNEHVDKVQPKPLSPLKENTKKNRRFSEQIQIDAHDLRATPFFNRDNDWNKSQNVENYLTISFKDPLVKQGRQKMASVSSSNFQAPKIDDDPQDMVGKISTLLGEYENAYQLHDDNFQKMMKKSKIMKSLVFNENNQQKKVDIDHRKDSFGYSRDRIGLVRHKSGGLFQNLGKSIYDTFQLEDNSENQVRQN